MINDMTRRALDEIRTNLLQLTANAVFVIQDPDIVLSDHFQKMFPDWTVIGSSYDPETKQVNLQVLPPQENDDA